MKDLEGIKDDIIITTTKKWYYPDGDFNTYGIPKKREYAFSNASRGGYRGLRSFVDVTAFFMGGLENGLIPYDEILEKQFSFPFLSVYTCEMDDIKKMTPQQYALLNTNHGIWVRASHYHSYALYANEGCFLSTPQYHVPEDYLLLDVGDG